MNATTERAFFALIERTDKCWLWRGRTQPNGYGKLGERYAHRISFEIANGSIPVGTEIDHLCGIRSCVNPEHLRAVSHKVNVLAGNTFVARQAAQTHCKMGHPLVAENIYKLRSGKRICKTCGRERDRARYPERYKIEKQKRAA